jgi:hypothetical protein
MVTNGKNALIQIKAIHTFGSRLLYMPISSFLKIQQNGSTPQFLIRLIKIVAKPFILHIGTGTYVPM